MASHQANILTESPEESPEEPEISRCEIRPILSHYLRARNYTEIHLEDLSVNDFIRQRMIEKEISRPHSILFNFDPEDLDAEAVEENYSQLISWVRAQQKLGHFCGEIEPLLGALFGHLYVELVRCGKNERAESFLRSNVGVVEEMWDELVRGLVQLPVGELEGSELVSTLLRNKYVFSIPAGFLEELKTFILKNCQLVFLQVIQGWFELREVAEKESNIEDIHIEDSVESKVNKYKENVEAAELDRNLENMRSWLNQLIESSDEDNRFEDIDQIVGPLFCHLYLDIEGSGDMEAAGQFKDSHLATIGRHSFSGLVKDLVDAWLEGKDHTSIATKFRKDKTPLEVSSSSVELLRNFFTTCQNSFQKTFMTWIEIRERSSIEHHLSTSINTVNQNLVFVTNFHLSKQHQEVTCGLIDRAYTVIAYAEGSSAYLIPIHKYNSLLDDIDTSRIELKGHTNQIYSIRISVKYNLLASVSADQTLCLYNLETLELTQKCSGHLGAVYCVAIASNGQHVITGSQDTTARVWCPDSGNTIRIFAGHSQSVTSVDIHPNCLYAITGSADCTIRMWSVPSGEPVRLFYGTKTDIYTVKFNPNGRTLATGGADEFVRIWDILTSKLITEIATKQTAITHLAWNPDSTELCIGSSEANIQIWNLQLEPELKQNNLFEDNFYGKIISVEHSLGSFVSLTTSNF